MCTAYKRSREQWLRESAFKLVAHPTELEHASLALCTLSRGSISLMKIGRRICGLFNWHTLRMSLHSTCYIVRRVLYRSISSPALVWQTCDFSWKKCGPDCQFWVASFCRFDWGVSNGDWDNWMAGVLKASVWKIWKFVGGLYSYLWQLGRLGYLYEFFFV